MVSKRVLRALASDLEASEEPFAPLAAAAGMGQEEWLEEVKRLLEAGLVRRFGAVLNHYAAGMTANAMVVWCVGEEQVDRVANLIAAFPAVSHCYERPPLPDFPYNLYSMIHAVSWEECEAIIRDISQRTGITDYLPLRTVKEFKKSSPPMASEVVSEEEAGSEE